MTFYKLSIPELVEKLELGGHLLIDEELIDTFWRRVQSPSYNNEMKNHPDDKAGKWLIFISNTEEQFLEHWTRIKEATLEGKLGIAAKITNPQFLPGDSLVICVYTRDYSDIENVTEVREALRELGYTRILPYKPDYETLAGRYGSETVLYRS